MADLKIVTHEDGSITITETDINGKVLSVTYPPEAAHDELVRRGAKCGHTHLVEIDSDDPLLSEATRAEIKEKGIPILTNLKTDREELHRLNDEFNTAWENRIIVSSDMADIESRNDRIDSLDSRMRELREQIAVLEACIAIAVLDTTDEGGTI
jgi:predicted  nucleic acid-binding Zn-ribbon protein